MLGLRWLGFARKVICLVCYLPGISSVGHEFFLQKKAQEADINQGMSFSLLLFLSQPAIGKSASEVRGF